MLRPILMLFMLVSITAVALSASAQGRRPASPGATGATPAPAVSRPAPTDPFSVGGPQRQSAETRRAAAEARREEAAGRRAQAESNNRSAEARAEHPPNEHAADEAFLAGQNAENADTRSLTAAEEKALHRAESRRDARRGNQD